MDTKALANKLVAKHGTRNPFIIAENMGYIVLYVPLFELRGFYKYVKKCNIIYINNNLDDLQAKLVCAHEILHSLEHRGNNRIFMDNHTRMVSSRFETEAHRFSVDLVYDDDEVRDLLGYPVQTVADILGVSAELAKYRMSTVEPDYFIEETC